MNSKQFSFENRIYSVVNCTKEDIPSHIERVSSYWETVGVNLEEQTKLLEKSVDSDFALKVVDDTGIDRVGMYIIPRNYHEGDCYYMFLDNKRVLMMLCYYLRIVLCIDTLYFLPHTKDFIPFRFLVDENSIRNFHAYGTPLRISLYSDKSNHLYEDQFIKYGIKEL